MKPQLISVFGVTNSGKSTLMNRAKDIAGVGTIEVGKEMRRRYPPGHFDGKGAMQKTEEEVWSIVDEQYDLAASNGARVVLIDGQPRLPEQIPNMLARFGEFDVIWLTCPHGVLLKRAEGRDEHRALDLSMKRLVNDYQQLYDTLAAYFRYIWRRPLVLDTTSPAWLELATDSLQARL
jgi:adenylate kinase family enzyme